jgi:hypothetical protein
MGQKRKAESGKPDEIANGNWERIVVERLSAFRFPLS